jgi:hypothetical protein
VATLDVLNLSRVRKFLLLLHGIPFNLVELHLRHSAPLVMTEGSLRAFVNTLCEATPTLSFTFKDMVDFFKRKSACLWKQEVHDRNEGEVDCRPSTESVPEAARSEMQPVTLTDNVKSPAKILEANGGNSNDDTVH